MAGDAEGWFREETFKEALYLQNRVLELMRLIKIDVDKLMDAWSEWQALRSSLELRTRPPSKN